MRVQVPSDAYDAFRLLMTNLFDYLEEAPLRTGSPGPWSVWAPRRPQRRFDLTLLPRSPTWQEDPDSLEALERIGRESWVSAVTRRSRGVALRLDDDWIGTAG